MSDLLLELVDMNENVDYGIFVQLFCSYLLILWIAISAWVGVDARKRLDKKYAIMFFFLVLILNFPMLIFYFIVRPEEQYENYDQWDLGGVNVPLVNFVGKEGVEMVLELKLNPSQITSKVASDMKIDVSWDSPKENMQLVSKNEKNELQKDKPDQRIQTHFFNFSGLVEKRIKKIKEVSASYKNWRRKTQDIIKKDEVQKVNNAEQIKQAQNVNQKKKNKKKKKKNK